MLNFSSIFPEDISEDFSSYKKRNLNASWAVNEKPDFVDYMSVEQPNSWSLEKGYATNNELIKPLRATKRLEIFIRTREQFNDEFDLCTFEYKLLFHLPNEVPSSFDLSTNIEFDSDIAISLNAVILKHDETLKQFSPEQRGCYFEAEKKLKFFKSYTKNNCEHECMINYTLSKCNCVEFSMPRTDDLKVCDYDDKNCYDSVLSLWSNSFYQNEENQEKYPDYPCDCMPSCTQIIYGLTERDLNQKYEILICI
ncbi:unnamed protein product [Chironomus riparius]|uniref:Uncharacterized protein n=1 Tax=Chironomus riparius TaxID=315576 RepID=A0A9N9WL74_9DIPT|nr:unnamed protein product [Chironomus riparius]